MQNSYGKLGGGVFLPSTCAIGWEIPRYT